MGYNNFPPTMLPVGTMLSNGKYRVDKFLSSGGFSITYMATNMFDETVVIKEFFMKNVNQRDDDSTTVCMRDPNNRSVFEEYQHRKRPQSVADVNRFLSDL